MGAEVEKWAGGVTARPFPYREEAMGQGTVIALRQVAAALKAKMQ
jgi:hypothetical protein